MKYLLKLKFIILSVALIFGGLINAQEVINESELDKRKIMIDDTVTAEELKKAMKQAKEESDKVIREETEKLKQELKLIEEKEAKGEITGEQAIEEKQRAAEEASKKINEAGKNIEEQANIMLQVHEKELEEIEEIIEENQELLDKNYSDLERQAIILELKAEKLHNLSEELEEGKYDDDDDFYGIRISDDEDNIVISFSDKSKHKKYKHHKKRTRFKFDIDFGWDGLEDYKHIEGTAAEYPDFDMWPSMYFGFSFNGKTRMFKENSPLHIKYGLGLQWSNYRVKGDYILEKVNDQPMYVEDPFGRNLEVSRIRNLYMTAPVMLQLDFSKHRMDTGFKIGIGAYGGVRWYTWQTVKFKDADGDKNLITNRNKYYVNPFSYGLQAEIGYGAFSVVGKYELSPFFDVDNPYDYQVWNIGAKFSF
ncbi:MAG: outer membrane beta-barrel protein [Bacteroidota bacterium]